MNNDTFSRETEKKSDKKMEKVDKNMMNELIYNCQYKCNIEKVIVFVYSHKIMRILNKKKNNN